MYYQYESLGWLNTVNYKEKERANIATTFQDDDGTEHNEHVYSRIHPNGTYECKCHRVELVRAHG